MNSQATRHPHQNVFLERLEQVRALIDDTLCCPTDTAALVAHLQQNNHRRHSAIDLAPHSAALQLAGFVVRYIEHAPEFIEAIYTITAEADLEAQVTPLLSIAVDYFLHPPELLQANNALLLVFYQAYLAHRLLEEINDRFIALCGSPLAPMDTTRANVVAHELIGEPYATELGQAVLFSADLLLYQYPFKGPAFERFFAQHRQHGWSVELSRWPCLAADRAIFLNFKSAAEHHER
jgi:hypothetical protein